MAENIKSETVNGNNLVVEYILYTDLVPNENQVRKTENIYTHIKSLRDDISEHGIREPLKVRKLENGKYQIVDGECRYRACMEYDHLIDEKYKFLPCIVLSDADAEDWGLVANILRLDLTPCEKSNALKSYQDKNKMDVKAMSLRFGMSTNSIYDYLYLQKLPKKIMDEELASGLDCLPLKAIREFAVGDKANVELVYKKYKSKQKMILEERNRFDKKDLEKEIEERDEFFKKKDDELVKRGSADTRGFEKMVNAFEKLFMVLEEKLEDRKKNNSKMVYLTYANNESEDIERLDKMENCLKKTAKYLEDINEELELRRKTYSSKEA